MTGDPTERVTEARRRAWEQNRADYARHEWGYADSDGWPASFPVLSVSSLRRWLHAVYRFFHIEPRS